MQHNRIDIPFDQTSPGGPADPLGTASIGEAAAALRAGQAVILPTDTLYGLGVAVEHATGPGILFELKRRPADKPVSWLVGGLDALDRYAVDVPSIVRTWAADFWPGGLTFVLRASQNVPPAFRAADGSIGLRMPANDTALELIAQVGCPLATTSANISGQPGAERLADVSSELRDAVLAVRDDGPKAGIASTVVDCLGAEPRILRQGDVVLPL